MERAEISLHVECKHEMKFQLVSPNLSNGNPFVYNDKVICKIHSEPFAVFECHLLELCVTTLHGHVIDEYEYAKGKQQVL